METQDNFAPYAPLENVLRVLNKARAGSLKGPVDTSFLIQLGIGDSMAPRTIRALEFLGFIQPDGASTPRLEQYVVASDDEAKTVLRQAVEQSYAMVLRAVNPTVDPRAKIFNAFRPMKPQGQWDRMVTLFLGLCREAGIEVKEAPSNRPGRLDSPREAPRGQRQKRVAPKRQDSSSDRVQWGPIRWETPSRETLDPSLTAFIGKLRDVEDEKALNEWYAAFKTLFLYNLSTRPKRVQSEISSDSSEQPNP